MKSRGMWKATCIKTVNFLGGVGCLANLASDILLIRYVWPDTTVVVPDGIEDRSERIFW